MSEDLKVGDKVKECFEYDNRIKGFGRGKGFGKVIKVIKNYGGSRRTLVCVEFENNWGGHNGAGWADGKLGHCWNYLGDINCLIKVPQYKWRKI